MLESDQREIEGFYQTLSTLIRRLRYAVPQHRDELGEAV